MDNLNFTKVPEANSDKLILHITKSKHRKDKLLYFPMEAHTAVNQIQEATEASNVYNIGVQTHC
jgi:hypothetical protein